MFNTVYAIMNQSNNVIKTKLLSNCILFEASECLNTFHSNILIFRVQLTIFLLNNLLIIVCNEQNQMEFWL